MSSTPQGQMTMGYESDEGGLAFKLCESSVASSVLDVADEHIVDEEDSEFCAL